MAEGRYARVYYDEIARDAKFDGIRSDRDVMGSWLLLLIEAEKAWPAPAFRPPASWVPTAHFKLFADRGIIDLEPDGRYAMHGLEGERRKRHERASNAAAKRWSTADSNASGTAVGNAYAGARVVSSDSPLISENGVGGVGEGDDGRADLEAFLAVRFRAPTPAQRQLMDGYLQAFDVTGPERAAGLILANPDDPIGALKADLAEFRKQRVSQLVEKAATKRRRKGTGLSSTNQEMAKLMTSPTLLTAAHNGGAHADEPDPRCRYCRERLEVTA